MKLKFNDHVIKQCMDSDVGLRIKLVNYYIDLTLDKLEERYPEYKRDSYSTILVETDDGSVLYHAIWTRAKAVDYVSDDGWTTSYSLTDLPIRIETIIAVGTPRCEMPTRKWLFRDVNQMSGTQVDYVAEPTFKDGKINWGFNGVNAVLLFRELCDNYETMCASGNYVLINYNPYIGYWFGEMKNVTWDKYFTKETR